MNANYGENKKKPLYEVRSVKNDYAFSNKRPETLYFLEGPGGPGYHGLLMSPHLYFDDEDIAEKCIPMMTQAYYAGFRTRSDQVKSYMAALLGGHSV